MRQACRLIFATCMLSAFCPAIAKSEPDSLWNHNGSVMGLYVVGDKRILRYQEPRIGMRQEGVVSGTVRFEGIQSGSTYSGTAFVFSRRCGARPYQVTGTISDDGREIMIYGTAPAGFDDACRPIVFRKDAVRFNFLRSVNPLPLIVGSIDRDLGAAEAVAERARLEEARAAKEREEQGLLLEEEERRLAEVRSFSIQRDACQRYKIEACDSALRSPHASPRDVIELRSWRDVAERLQANLNSCRIGSSAACDAALASPAVTVEQRHLLNEWRVAASPFNRVIAVFSTYARRAATATIDGVTTIRNLPTSAHITGGLAAALALAGMALRRRYPLPSGGPDARALWSSASHIADSTIVQTLDSFQRLSDTLNRLSAVVPYPASPTARNTPGAIAALELAYAYIDDVREAETPGSEDHDLRKYHLNTLALASKQLNAAKKLDPDAILEGQNENFTINELRAQARMLEGITYHTSDIRRAISALRKATRLSANSPHAFYILGVAHAANANMPEALAALQRAVVLNPENLSYRDEFNRVQTLSSGKI